MNIPEKSSSLMVKNKKCAPVPWKIRDWGASLFYVKAGENTRGSLDFG